jgi:hypothetical protein
MPYRQSQNYLPRLFCLVAVFIFALIFADFYMISNAEAAVVRQIPFSARLKSASSDLPVPDGTYTVAFTLYDAETGGTALWTESQSIAVVNGVVSTNLGSTSAFPDSLTFNDANYYLGVKVGDDAEMAPRRRMIPVPVALNADTVDGAHAGTGANNVLQLDGTGQINIPGNITTTGTLQGVAVTTSTLTTASGNLTVAPAGGTTNIVGNVSLQGNLLPSTTGTYDLGSSSNRFSNAYIDNLVVGSTSTAGTSSTSFTINDSAVADADGALNFYRGGVLASAQLLWNSTTDRFNFNNGVAITGDLTTTSTINGATISGGTLSGGSVTGGALSASAVNGVSIAAGTITSPTIAGTLTGSGSPTITGFGTINGATLSGGTLSGGSLTGGTYTGTSLTAAAAYTVLAQGGNINLQASSGIVALNQASATNELRVYENSATPTNYAFLRYDGSGGLLATNTGNMQIGSGGDVTLNSGVNLNVTGTPATSATSSLARLGNALVGGSANGTYLGANSASGYTGDFANFQVDGSTKFKVDSTGNLTASGAINGNTLSLPATTISAGNITTTRIISDIYQDTNGNSFMLFSGTSPNRTLTLGNVSTNPLISFTPTTAGYTRTLSAPTSANFGAFSIGPAATSFDGATAGFFAGSASGTELAVNAASGYAGNLIDLQTAGTSRFKVDGSGNMTITGTGSHIFSGTIRTSTLTSGGLLSINSATGSNITVTANGAGRINLVPSSNGSSGVTLGDGGTTNYTKFDNNGVLSYVGSARPNRETELFAQDATVAASGGCAAGQVETNAWYKVIDCDASTDESAFWQVKMPDNYASTTTIQADIYWVSDAQTTGSVVYNAAYAGVTTNEEWDNPSLTTVAGTASATSGTAKRVNTTTINLTTPTVDAGDLLHFRLTRDADNGSDTMTGDARVLKVRLKYLVTN